ENEEWDFLAVYYDAIDHFCHGFMKFHPPRRDHIPLADYELYNEVVNAGCRYHDLMLSRLLDLAGEDTTVILISDHGFHPDHNRPRFIPDEPAGPAVEHSPYGIIVMKGPNIKQEEALIGASILDITPTLLHLYDLPVAEDMDGKVLLQAFASPEEIKTIKSWENIKGTDGRHPAGMEIDPVEAKEELRQLIELGYIEDPGEESASAVKKVVDENNYNLARSYINGGKWEEGIKLLTQLHEENPTVLRYAVQLCHAYQNTSQFLLARKLVNHIRATLDRESPQLDLLEGTLLLSEQRFKKALELFQKAEREGGNQPHLQLRISHAYLQLQQLEAAEVAAKRALEDDPESEYAHYGLGLIHYNALRYEAALASFLTSIALMYYQPLAHFHVGECLYKLKQFERAIESYEVSLQMVPGLNLARQRLIFIYEHELQQPGLAIKYKRAFQEKIKGTITIVSGLPRSGTSMMMQMLEAGGMSIFTDKTREANESNPKGFYEHEAVKGLVRNKKFLTEAVDKVVKVIAHLLPQLPLKYRYRILFMERNLQEVVRSQQKMLLRDNKHEVVADSSATLTQQYGQTLKMVKAWADKQPAIEVIYVQHRDVLSNPFQQALIINDFLEGELQVEKIAAVVDQGLHRERVS
ncbi:MAG: tetratricopeptide repeat protein, partial [Bacteroidota bacterium]